MLCPFRLAADRPAPLPPPPALGKPVSRPAKARPLPAHLQALLGRVDRAPQAVLALGDRRVDAHLPGGGLPLGQLHEVGAEGLAAETGALAAAFIACLLARLPAAKPVFWIATRCDLYPPGLLDTGFDPARLVLVAARDDAETLAAMETALAEPAAVAVVGEVGKLDRVASRRLQLACLRHATTGFVLRRWPYGRKATADGAPAREQEPTAAVTRWRLAPAPSAAEEAGAQLSAREPGASRWCVALTHARGGREGAWILEFTEASDEAPHSLRVVAGLADHPAASGGLRAAG
jgi:protein ImuA